MTLADMLVSLASWMKEDVSSSLGIDAVNDAVESLHESLVTFALQDLLGAPVNLTLAAGTERIDIITIPDPVTVQPVVTGVVSGALPQRSCKFAITYITESGSETLPSLITAFVVPANRVAHVASPPVANAFGYNVYAADNAWGVLYRVNPSPLPIGLDWQEVAASPMFIIGTGNAQEVPPDGVVAPIENGTGDNITFIQHMELKTPEGIWRPWNQADLDSQLMRRMGLSIASTSAYEGYAWDLVNNNRVEVRPALGSTWTPRFFPVVKPRRLLFTQATLAFGNVSGAIAFIRYFSLSLLKLGEEEYQAASAWGTKAEQERNHILQSRVKAGRNRNDRVTPFMR